MSLGAEPKSFFQLMCLKLVSERGRVYRASVSFGFFLPCSVALGKPLPSLGLSFPICDMVGELVTSMVPSCSEIWHWGIFEPRLSLALELNPLSCGTLSQCHVGQAPHVAKGMGSLGVGVAPQVGQT